MTPDQKSSEITVKLNEENKVESPVKDIKAGMDEESSDEEEQVDDEIYY